MSNFKGLLAVDPGDTVGVAVFSKDAVLQYYGEFPHDELSEKLIGLYAEYDFSHIVVEDFKLFGHLAKQQIGSHFTTSQGIGQCELFAKMSGLGFTKQYSNILPIAQMWSQKKVPPHGNKNHGWMSAYNHGFYWMCKSGYRETVLKEAERARKEEGR